MTSISASRAEAASTEARARIRSRRRARARQWDRVATVSLWGIAGFISLVFLFIVIYTIGQGLPSISWQFFTSGDPLVGIAPQVLNTFYLIIMTMIIMIPIGMGAAIYLVEYSRKNRFTQLLQFATDTLTSTPTIVIGMLGFLVFATHFGSGAFLGVNRLTASLTLAIINLPWALRVFQDALIAVPRDYREASFGIGASRLQTVMRTVLPAAIPGIITGILILSGRIIGESAALLFTAGQTTPLFGWGSLDPRISGETLALHAFNLFSADFSQNGTSIRLGTALTLIVLVLIFNASARFIGNYVHRRFSGK